VPEAGQPGEVEFARQPSSMEVKHEQGINKIAGRAAGILLLKNQLCELSTEISELDNA